MKNFTILLLATIVFAFYGCAPSQKKYLKENGETNVSVWWNAPKYITSKKYYRSHGNGVSNVQSVSESKAMLDAKAGLTKQIKSAVSVIENSKVKDVNGTATTSFEQFTKLVAEQSLTNIKTVSQTIGKKDNGYDVNVVIEVPKAEIIKAILSEFDKQRLGISQTDKDNIIKKIENDGADNTKGDK